MDKNTVFKWLGLLLAALGLTYVFINIHGWLYSCVVYVRPPGSLPGVQVPCNFFSSTLTISVVITIVGIAMFVKGWKGKLLKGLGLVLAIIGIIIMGLDIPGWFQSCLQNRALLSSTAPYCNDSFLLFVISLLFIVIGLLLLFISSHKKK